MTCRGYVWGSPHSHQVSGKDMIHGLRRRRRRGLGVSVLSPHYGRRVFSGSKSGGGDTGRGDCMGGGWVRSSLSGISGEAPESPLKTSPIMPSRGSAREGCHRGR